MFRTIAVENKDSFEKFTSAEFRKFSFHFHKVEIETFIHIIFFLLSICFSFSFFSAMRGSFNAHAIYVPSVEINVRS